MVRISDCVRFVVQTAVGGVLGLKAGAEIYNNAPNQRDNLNVSTLVVVGGVLTAACASIAVNRLCQRRIVEVSSQPKTCGTKTKLLALGVVSAVSGFFSQAIASAFGYPTHLGYLVLGSSLVSDERPNSVPKISDSSSKSNNSRTKETNSKCTCCQL